MLTTTTTTNRKNNTKNHHQHQNKDQAQFFYFLRSLVFSSGSPSSSAHRKMIILLDDNSHLYRTPIDFIKKSHVLPLLKEFVDAQRGRLSLALWSAFDNEARPDGKVEDDDDDEALIQKIPKVLGPSQSVWFILPVNFCTPKLLRCVALYLMCGRLHPNTRFFVVCSRRELYTKFDDIALVPTIARHACTTIARAPRSGRTRKIFAAADLKKLGVFPIADSWSRDLSRATNQTRDEWGGETISVDCITTAGVALIEDVLTSADNVQLVKFSEKYGKGSAFVKNIASALRFNYTTHTLDFTDSACNDDPMAEFGPSLRSSRKLTTLILKKCYLGDIGFTDLGAAVRDCSSLTSLDVSDNSIVTTDGLLALAMCLAVETDDEEFRRDDLFSTDDLSPARQLLSGEKHRGRLGGVSSSSATNTTLHDVSGIPVCRLKKLYLRGCNSVTSTRTMWSHKGLRQFFRYLGRISSLEELDMSNNSFTEEDAVNFAEFCVPPPKTYDSNGLDANVVDATDLMMYSGKYQTADDEEAEFQKRQREREGLKKKTNNNINMSTSIGIGGDGLDVTDNDNNNHSYQLLSYRFVGLKLKVLNLSGNSIGDAGAGVIVTRLAPTLRRVDLSHCALSARAFLYCGLCVSRFPSFREFILSYNDLSWEHALRLPTPSKKKPVASSSTTLEEQENQLLSSKMDNNKYSYQQTLDRFLNGDGGLRESLENIPATVSLSAIDVSESNAGDVENKNNNSSHQPPNTIRSLLDGVKVLTPEEKEELEEKKKRKQAIAAKKLRTINQGFGTESQDESQFCWFVDRFLQCVSSPSATKRHQQRNGTIDDVQPLTLVLDIAHCVLATASVRTLFEGGILRGLVKFESLFLSGNYGVRGETISLLAGEVTGHPEHSRYLKNLGLDDTDPEVRERALIGVFLASSSAFDATQGIEERSAVTGQIIKKKEKERHRANMETLFLRGPEVTDGMVYAIRQCPVEMLPPLRVLDLSRMTILADGVDTICSTCVKCHQLEELIMSGIWCSFFSPELQKVVSLDETKDRGISILKHFADLIMDAKSLALLDLSDNGIGRSGVKCLMGALKNRNTSLELMTKKKKMKKLVLTGNKLRDLESIDEIREMFQVEDEKNGGMKLDEELWEVVVVK